MGVYLSSHRPYVHPSTHGAECTSPVVRLLLPATPRPRDVVLPVVVGLVVGVVSQPVLSRQRLLDRTVKRTLFVCLFVFVSVALAPPNPPVTHLSSEVGSGRPTPNVSGRR